MFDSAAASYSPLNRILTFGQDEIWRQAAVDIIEPHSGGRILDICTGTGDLALKLAKGFSNLKIYALDYSENMLAAARKRAGPQNRQNLIIEEGDCANLEFDSGYFDYVTVSFGLRNLSYSRDNLIKALGEIYRVLKSGGRFIILETSQPANAFIRKFFHLYAAGVVPMAGRLISGKKEPYSYLGNSIVKFFDQDRLMDILVSAGFRKEKTVPFMFGAIMLCAVQK